ncbi:hypothetical protein J1C51_23590 [Chromobacterium haemolyticum]|uniref:hypothetical protein n=1 Tax=Chromobacterium haemolyticum TaxID=394935 RepID=UPI001A91472E|nr:hypothetical protein [Chromobacterium haemolyticum]MBO0501761.1 hypothetical protein [Chromobacterium haemolyticum]
MKTLQSVVGFLVLTAAVFAAPAVIGSVLAGAAGLLMMASASVGHSAPPPSPRIVQIVQAEPTPAMRVYELERGAAVVVFKQIDGKLVSRMYRVAGGVHA